MGIILSLPIKTLSVTPFSAFAVFSDAGVTYLTIYYGLGILAIMTSITLYKTKDASFNELFYKK
jgi:predicted membrane channel-forming protein YqfA (hemolysin III family)